MFEVYRTVARGIFWLSNARLCRMRKLRLRLHATFHTFENVEIYEGGLRKGSNGSYGWI